MATCSCLLNVLGQMIQSLCPIPTAVVMSQSYGSFVPTQENQAINSELSNNISYTLMDPEVIGPWAPSSVMHTLVEDSRAVTRLQKGHLPIKTAEVVSENRKIIHTTILNVIFTNRLIKIDLKKKKEKKESVQISLWTFNAKCHWKKRI